MFKKKAGYNYIHFIPMIYVLKYNQKKKKKNLMPHWPPP